MRTHNSLTFGLAVMCIIQLLSMGIIDAQQAFAATYYVGKQGRDNNSCTDAQSRSAAKLTINEGLKCLTAGDTLYIGAGAYEEAINENSVIPSGTSWNNVVTIAAAPGESVVLRPSGTYEVICLVGSSISYIVFDGLVLDARNVDGHGLSLTNGAHHVRFQNGEVMNAPNQGILLTSGSGGTEHNELIKLNIHNNGRGRLSHGVYIATSNNLIEYSDVHHNSGYGIHIYDDNGGVNGNVVRFNIARNNSTHDCCDGGIVIGSGKDNIAYNNIVYENQYGIVVGYSGATNTKIYNNTVYNNLQYGIEIRASSTNAIIKNNIFYLNLTPISDLGIATTLSHNLTSDPKFVNASVFDFTLQPGSSAIDAGENINEVAVDFRGTGRPQGTNYDIGAYEYEEPRSVSPPAAPSSLHFIPQ